MMLKEVKEERMKEPKEFKNRREFNIRAAGNSQPNHRATRVFHFQN